MDIKLSQYSTWLTLNIGKTNQNARLEYGSALRHRDYRACLVPFTSSGDGTALESLSRVSVPVKIGIKLRF